MRPIVFSDLEKKIGKGGFRGQDEFHFSQSHPVGQYSVKQGFYFHKIILTIGNF
jgi:hypothetical protein